MTDDEDNAATPATTSTQIKLPKGFKEAKPQYRLPFEIEPEIVDYANFQPAYESRFKDVDYGVFGKPPRYTLEDAQLAPCCLKNENASDKSVGSNLNSGNVKLALTEEPKPLHQRFAPLDDDPGNSKDLLTDDEDDCEIIAEIKSKSCLFFMRH